MLAQGALLSHSAPSQSFGAHPAGFVLAATFCALESGVSVARNLRSEIRGQDLQDVLGTASGFENPLIRNVSTKFDLII